MRRFVDLVESTALAVCAGAVLLMMLIGAWDIVSGNLLGFYLAFKVELSGTLLASCIFLACGAVQRNQEHIKVDAFEHLLPDALRHVRDLLVIACALLVMALITYGLWRLAMKSIAIREISADTLGFAIWPWKLACAVGASLCTAVIVGQFLQAVVRSASRLNGVRR